MEDITAQLEELGLGEYEAAVYAALAATSPASATLIAKKCDLSRSSVYTTLSTLIAKGLVGTTYKNDVKQFIAQDVSSFEQLVKAEHEILQKKAKVLTALKSNLAKVARTDTQVPEIVFFEGQEGLKKIYLSMMRQAPMHSVRYLLRDEFIWEPAWSFNFESDWQSRVDRIKSEKKMTTKLLVNPSALEKSKVKYYAKQKSFAYRFLPAKHKMERFAMYIIGDTTAIMSMEQNNLVGVKISNQHLADNFKQIFEALWQSAAK